MTNTPKKTLRERAQDELVLEMIAFEETCLPENKAKERPFVLLSLVDRFILQVQTETKAKCLEALPDDETKEEWVYKKKAREAIKNLSV